MSNIYQFKVTNIKGQEVDLSDFTDELILIVNTASACGFTPQYAGLENLYQKYKKQGFTVLAFPCNQFGKQEKGSSTEIAQFCDLQFNVSFPLMDKIDVNGDNCSPLFTYLKTNAPGLLGTKSIKWNFTKFLINKTGKVIKRYAPSTKPEAIEQDIQEYLTKK